MSISLVPAQEKGKSVDLQEEIILEDVESAKKLFRDAVYILARPVLWHSTAGALSASFSVDGQKQERSVEPGDHIHISIPGPGLQEGDGEDWVQVGAMEKDFDQDVDESFGILLCVSPNPHTKSKAIAHFFAEGASSTLLVTRKNKTITAFYKGRNELPNTDKLELKDKVRNVVVAGGALAGISALQWSALLKGLLATDDD